MSAGRRETPNGPCCRSAPDPCTSRPMARAPNSSRSTPEFLALIVSVAGPGKQIAHDHIQVEVLDIHVPEPPAPQPVIIQQLMHRPHDGDAAPSSAARCHEMTLGALETGRRATIGPAEARTVAGCIRSVIGRLNTGLMPPGRRGGRNRQANRCRDARAGPQVGHVRRLRWTRSSITKRPRGMSRPPARRRPS
jgi:hypothetical protein